MEDGAFGESKLGISIRFGRSLRQIGPTIEKNVGKSELVLSIISMIFSFENLCSKRAFKRSKA